FAVTSKVNLLADREINPRAIASPLRRGRTTLCVGKQSHVNAVGVHDEYLVVRIPIRGECDLAAVWRPRRPSVERRMVSKIPGIGPIGVRYEHFGVHFAQHATEGYMLPVR